MLSLLTTGIGSLFTTGVSTTGFGSSFTTGATVGSATVGVSATGAGWTGFIGSTFCTIPSFGVFPFFFFMIKNTAPPIIAIIPTTNPIITGKLYIANSYLTPLKFESYNHSFVFYLRS